MRQPVMSARSLLVLVLVAVVLLGAALALWLAGVRLPGTARPAVVKSESVVWVNQWKSKPARLQHIAFPSKSMGHKVGISIVPPAHTNPAPLIIFLHGRGGDETSDLAAFMGFLRPVLAQLQLPEPLVVFPNGGLTGYRGAMASMLIDELVPYLEQHYRLLPDRRQRLLAGFSMGGAGAVRLTLQNPHVFGGAVSWGGGVWHKDAALFESVLARAEELRQLDLHFLLVNGSDDRPNAFVPLAEVFQQTGVAHQRLVLQGVGHEMGVYFDATQAPFTELLRTLWSVQP